MRSSALKVVLMVLFGITVSVAADDSAMHNNLPDQIEDLEIPVLPFDRNVAFASWILELDEEKIVDWLTQSTRSSWKAKPKTRSDVQALLVRRLTGIDPEKALNFALQRLEPHRSTMMNIVFEEWAQDDLDGAMQRVNSLEYFDKREVLDSVFAVSENFSLDETSTIEKEFGEDLNPPPRPIGSYISLDSCIRPASTQPDPLVGDSIENPMNVWYAIVENARPNSIHYQNLAEVATAWVNESGIGVLDAIRASLSDYEIRKSVVSSTLVKLVATMPDQAFEYAIEIKFPGRNRTIRLMVNKWARIDPIAAINRVHSIPSSQFRRRLEGIVLANWMSEYEWAAQFRGDPSWILESLSLIPEDFRGDASAVAVRRMVRTASPSLAAQTVLQMDDQSQPKAARALVEAWSRKDLESAIEWAKATPEIESIRTEVLSSLVWSIAQDKPSVAFQIAREITTPGHGFGLEGEVISQIAPFEPDTAMELLPHVRDGKTKLNAYESVATVLLQSGRTKETLELGTQLPEERGFAYAYYLRMGAAWARFDPQGLVDSLDQFPTAEVRSGVATQQIRWNSSTNRFSEQQVLALRNYLIDEDRDFLDSN